MDKKENYSDSIYEQYGIDKSTVDEYLKHGEKSDQTDAKGTEDNINTLNNIMKRSDIVQLLMNENNDLRAGFIELNKKNEKLERSLKDAKALNRMLYEDNKHYKNQIDSLISFKDGMITLDELVNTFNDDKSGDRVKKVEFPCEISLMDDGTPRQVIMIDSDKIIETGDDSI